MEIIDKIIDSKNKFTDGDALKAIIAGRKADLKARRKEEAEVRREIRNLEATKRGHADAKNEIKKIQDLSDSTAEYKNALEALEDKYFRKEALMSALDDAASGVNIWRGMFAAIGSVSALIGVATNDIPFAIGGLALAIPAIGNFIAQRKGAFEERYRYYSAKKETMKEEAELYE